jgi:hypothetical protein
VATPTRSCRTCSERFTPTRFDQAHCGPCDASRRDVDLIDSCLRSSPGQNVDWVSLATGVPVERVVELAAEGRLVAAPAGADVPRACTCDPASPGRCGYCQQQLRGRLRDAAYDAAKAAPGPVRGMRMRGE